jgi:dephospho-CoA kinase
MNSIGLIGLTGGIGCGKSTALRAFASLNCTVLDADAICHELYNEPEGPVVRAIVKKWGNKVIKSNSANRKKIAEIVFNDNKELEWLNQLIHPLIFERTYKTCQYSKNLVIFDVPLLFEANWEKYFTKIICIWATPAIQMSRLKKRNWSNKEIKARINSQMDVNKKLERADFGIINTGNLALLSKQCKHILFEIKR